ncbi:MAG: hydrogenase formation protein HypD [Thermoleophilia bacterium]|nr:hydrogenase formation protein HypD [Thermoleophilia bacterium]
MPLPPLPYLDDFRDRGLVRSLLADLEERFSQPVKVMEICGTHTMAVSRHGLRQAVPENLSLISGPGCPVCVTSNRDIDTFIEMAMRPEVIAATFGDMLRVPGTRTGLAEARSRGADVRVVYSTLDALAVARKNPGREVVFFGVGFETTAPTVAAAIAEAAASGLSNFSVFSAHKTMPPALEALSAAPGLSIDAYLCPGHVSAIIGPDAYAPVVSEHGIPCVIAGFEPVDILQALIMIAAQLVEGKASVEVQYSRGVGPGGNPAARDMMELIFEPCDAEWRGLGTIPESGLAIRHQFAGHDATRRFEVDVSWSQEPRGCICGAILTGRKNPRDCDLFGRACLPEKPVGPCMVSSEGTCAAYYQYEI